MRGRITIEIEVADWRDTALDDRIRQTKLEIIADTATDYMERRADDLDIVLGKFDIKID